VIRTVFSFFRLLHSWYAPLLRTVAGGTAVALRAPFVPPALSIIPCSLIHTNFWDINSETGGKPLCGSLISHFSILFYTFYFPNSVSLFFHSI
jgi:hypothetical protein